MVKKLLKVLKPMIASFTDPAHFATLPLRTISLQIARLLWIGQGGLIWLLSLIISDGLVTLKIMHTKSLVHMSYI